MCIQFYQHHLLKSLSFLHTCSLHLNQNSLGCVCMEWFLSSVVYPIGLCIGFYAFTILLWLQQLWGMFSRFLLLFFLRMLWLFWVFCGSMWMFRIFAFYFHEECHWNLDRGCIESVDCLGQCGYFNNIKSSNLWAWISSNFCVSSWIFFQWSFIIFIVGSFISLNLFLDILHFSS